MIYWVVPTATAGPEAARSAAAALGGVVADIDDLARAEAAPLQARPAAVDLSGAVPDWSLPPPGPRPHGSARLDVSVPPGTVAWADPGHLARALRNVVANALTHSPVGGIVTVTAERVGGVVRIHIADQGPGIAPDDVAHVFERFYRADASRATDPMTGRPTGLGLGLTIARQLAEAHGGTLTAANHPEGGAVFIFSLPG